MATPSGNHVLSYKVDDLIRRASKKCGGEPMSGVDAEEAIESLNDLIQSLANKSVPISRIKEKQIQCSSSVASYEAGASIEAIYDMVWSLVSTDTDYALGRINRTQYLNYPTKNTYGKPSQYMVDEGLNSTTVYLWPIPTSNEILKFRGAIKPQFVTNLRQEIDLEQKYYPAIIAGLAYKMSFDRRGIDPQYRLELKQEFAELWEDADYEDRERDNWIIKVGF